MQTIGMIAMLAQIVGSALELCGIGMQCKPESQNVINAAESSRSFLTGACSSRKELHAEQLKSGASIGVAGLCTACSNSNVLFMQAMHCMFTSAFTMMYYDASTVAAFSAFYGQVCQTA